MRFNNKNVILPTPITPVDDRLRFEAIENSTFGLVARAANRLTVLEYSLDNGITWIDLTTSTNISLNIGDKVYIRGILTGNNDPSYYYTQFKMSGKIEAKGNIMYLYNYEHPELTTISYKYAFCNIFKGCTALVSPPELPATTLSEGCYRTLFLDCTSLTTAPELLATTLTTLCYNGMFYGCTSLTTAPELLATTLTNYCYTKMFYKCSRLSYIKCLATSGINSNNSTLNWVQNVNSTGTFTKASSASWPTGNNGIPSGWTVHTSL